MRTAAAFLLAVTLFSSPTVNAIEVGGKQWGTWTRDNSPYNVIGEVQVPPGSTLVIEPGVVVDFKGHYKLIVDSLAALLAVGTESDSIYFTAEDTAAGWHGLRFLYADSSSQIAFSRLEYGKATGEWPDDLGGAVFCYYSSPTMRNSVLSGNSANCNGGGICCYYSSVTISDNAVSDNSATDHGGGVYCFNCTPITITNNIIRENSAGRGGGIQCNICDNVSIISNVVSANRSTWSGAGIRLQRVPTGTITNNTICGNCGSQPNGSEGSGIYLKYSNLLVMGNIINGNSSEHFGGGIYCSFSNPLIMNNVITANSALNGGGLALCCNSHPNVINNILWSDTAGTGPEIYLRAAFSYTCTLTVACCDVEGGESGVFIDPGCVLNWGEGNIDLDPLFRDTDALDFHLMADYCGDPDNSPCIDSGDPESADSLLDCSLGLRTRSCDMGAYGGNNAGWWADVREDPNNGPPLPAQFFLKQNYPNPFNASTTIYYQVPIHGHVTLEVYNLLGQKVTTLLDGKERAGCGSVLWDGSGVSSGVYFYRLTAGDLSETKRMLLLK